MEWGAGGGELVVVELVAELLVVVVAGELGDGDLVAELGTAELGEEEGDWLFAAAVFFVPRL